MQEVDINTLVNKSNYLNEKLPSGIIIIGKIDEINIKYKYNELDLSKVECKKINYFSHQEEGSIKNHILPYSLKELWCRYNMLISLPDLPNSLKYLNVLIIN